MQTYAQTGFQSACSEFSEHTLSLDQRYDVFNPAKILIPLAVDAPLFGMAKGHLLLVDRSRTPRNGDLVLIEDALHCGIYRYESGQGKPQLWPGNLSMEGENGALIGGVVVLLIKEFIPSSRTDIHTESYLHNSSYEESKEWKHNAKRLF